MQTNIFILLIAAVVPLIVGFIWYHPKVMGTVWMNAAGLNADSIKGANMALMFGLTLLLSFFISFSMQFMAIHQVSIAGFLSAQKDFSTPGSESSLILEKLKGLYWDTYRTFKQGAFHGTLSAVFLVVPIFGINALFERKGFKYVAVNGGFWIICMALMGGIICAFA